MSRPGTEIREQLVRALHADLIGPYELDNPEAVEVLSLAPSRWYLTGFLAPKQAREQDDDPTAEEDHAAGSDIGGEDDSDSAGSQGMPKQKQRLPASLGLSVLLPPGDSTETIEVTLRWADYALIEPENDAQALRPSGSRRRGVWKRVPVPAKTITLPLDPKVYAQGHKVEGTVGVWLRGDLREAAAEGLQKGTRALSLFVVNERPPGERGRLDEQFMFQVELELDFARGIEPRPDLRGRQSFDEDGENPPDPDRDELLNDLQFRHRCEWAVGHGVSVAVPPGQEPVTRVHSAWIPRAEVLHVRTRSEKETATQLGMKALSELDDPEGLRAALAPLVSEYGAWLEGLQDEDEHPLGTEQHREVRDDIVLAEAQVARERIEAGIQHLAADPVARRAFCLANQAMHYAALQRSPERYASEGAVPSWRLFQLAFVLLSIPGVVDDRSDDRSVVDLIFFPTGGGKTEAYLGVIAFTLLLRRLRGQERPDGGLGVAVILRYTLRLLTLDQMGRASTLICALEILRDKRSAELGETRFSIGLWVGRSATANTMKEVAERIELYSSKRSKQWPCPLTSCPWCRAPLETDSFDLRPNPQQPKALILSCVGDDECPFAAANNPAGLPVIFVDEELYQELPCFLVATVDKFAMLPWRGETGKLFGKVVARSGSHFLGPADKLERDAEYLPVGLEAPELIIQDELHLISGPLGTMVGLYETALEQLSSEIETQIVEGRPKDVILSRPKIIASTATVRRATEQISALFGRPDVRQFPPPGLDDQETWFSTIADERDEDGELKAPARLYIGIAAPGRAMKAILLRSYATLLSAAAREYDAKGDPDQPADAYMTLVGYFNALRELGGMRRLVEDDVRTRCAAALERRPLEAVGPHAWLRERTVKMEPVELTSRRSTAEITENKRRLDGHWGSADNNVDVALASNMISVGVDIDRLGLMVVAGQPKTSAEYIQATSRVGRQSRWPGLVVTCFNVVKPRDRSHFERFTAYHESFYRFVEAPSLTPFSGPALERGLAATLVAMARFSADELARPEGAGSIGVQALREQAKRGVRALARRAGAQPFLEAEGELRQSEEVRKWAEDLLDAWDNIIAVNEEDGAATHYSRYDRKGSEKGSKAYLLHTVLDENRPPPNSDRAKFAAPTSMRDVEASVHLWLQPFGLGYGGGK